MSINEHDELYDLIEKFGDATSDLFEQLLKGCWVDNQGHKVALNAAMIALRGCLEEATKLRATLNQPEKKAQDD